MWNKFPEPDNSILQGDNLYSVKSVIHKSSQLNDRDLWKLYGYESQAGRSLFKMFNKGQAPAIYYPKPDTRKWSPIKKPSPKPCPQKTKISYPPIRMSFPKLPKPIDLIPKRKPEAEIQKEIEHFYKFPPLQGNVGVNRNLLIKQTQNKFSKSRGALPRYAELPILPEEDLIEDKFDKEYMERAYAKVPQKQIPFSQKKIKPKNEEEALDFAQEERLSKEDRELNYLYKMVENEILERQQYLEEIAHLDEPKIKKRVKNEIVERVYELEKIIKLLHQHKK